MSEIKVDNLTGKTSAGDITVTSEGGAATQSLQQGLAKAWRLDETLSDAVHVAEDSFNISSTSDINTGDLHISFTNVFSANNYCSVATQAAASANDIVTTRYGDSNSAKDDLRNYDGAYKDSPICYTTHGDLA